ncbi:YdhK family protein [Lysinibacillus odysseyi]|uniref:Lipoprotein n=1 Tax=Lysinibacillus odysseyi 34hs-1 = NBRC 100172 TaxID=1220589 RepID=A0A0A3JGL9_9BACI|nr:YdhK family protein [Lysinibacillus odysseyi]KGR86167.1 lipoprotein [Lysinibacillus odysseyi 34hs-1 = NBRC 100172]
MKKKAALGFLTFTLAFTLAACGEEEKEKEPTAADEQSEQQKSGHSDMEHSTMDHSGSGEVPEGLAEATNPAYPIGSKAIMHADHMEGMNDVEATIVGAYDTTVYAVSYTSTVSGEKMENHKWVIHEELENPGDAPLKPGTEVTLQADHMEGMEGAHAVIDSAEKTTVYMVDYTSANGEKVTNHKWVTESELASE